MNKLKMKKYLTLLSLITILIAAPLTTPIAFADNNDERHGQSENHGDEASPSDNSEPTSVTADITGQVTDLGIQKYEINGKGGLAYLFGEELITDPKIELKLKATVINDVVTGSLKLTVKDENENGKTQLTVNIPIIDGDPGYGCLNGISGELIVCPERPWGPTIVPFLELENGDFIPIFFAGVGDATLKIGKETTTYPVYVVIDTSTAQHPFKGGPSNNNGRVNISDMNGLFTLDVDVTKFDVEYTGIILEGGVSGDLIGYFWQSANSMEDHVIDYQSDKGDILFSVDYDGADITMTGSYEGESVQSPLLEYLYISTGTFKTSDDLKIKGEYVTIWTLPLFFESTFTGTVK